MHSKSSIVRSVGASDLAQTKRAPKGKGKEVGRYQDVALGHPVVVSRNDRDRQVMGLDDFTDADLAAVKKAKAPAAAAAFNDEI